MLQGYSRQRRTIGSFSAIAELLVVTSHTDRLVNMQCNTTLVFLLECGIPSVSSSRLTGELKC